MKKVMFMLAAVAAAGVAHAAALNWSMGMNNGVDASGNAIGAAESGTAIVLAFIGTATDGTSYDTAIAVNTGDWDIGEEEGEKYANVGGSLTSGGYTGTGALAAGNVYAIMFQDKDGKLHQLVDGSGAAITDTFTVPNSYSTQWRGSFNVEKDFGATSESYGGGSSDVPEPTSGLLLLVGGAMLALRRKQK